MASIRMCAPMKLAQLVKQIVSAVPEGFVTEGMLYASLDFEGPKNRDLAIPYWHDDPEFVDREMLRHELLTGEEEIQGDHLLFWFSAHDGVMRLIEVDSFAEAEAWVHEMIYSVWIDVVLVLEYLRLRPYRVTYRTRSGERVVFDRWGMDLADRDWPDRRIEWLTAGEH